MQQISDISFSFLSTQTCTHCQLYVTCGPVYVVNDLSILCGRCRMTAKDHFRNYAYEALASNFLYPCKNWENHCSVKLKWNDSLYHENECNYEGCCWFLCSHPGAFLKGKRDLPDDEVKMTMVPESLLEYLECVICRGYLNSFPVYIQSNGYNVCHRCIYANGNPPNCRRNHAYETFSQIFLFPCAYRNRGCNERHQFGRPIQKHESKCEYGPPLSNNNRNSVEPRLSYLKPSNEPQRVSTRPIERQPSYKRGNNNFPSPNSNQADQQRLSVKPKEKGIVKTHSGHIWATITPNKALFAPPEDEHQEINRQLLKSLAKKQGRQIRRADEIENDMGGRHNSESESISTNESYTAKNSSPNDTLDSRTPYILPEDYSRNNQQAYNSRPNSRESGYQTEPKYSLDSGYNQAVKPSGGYSDVAQSGQFPVLVPHQLNDGFDSIHRESFRESFKRESARGNPLLINELKLKQDQIKRTHSIKGVSDLNSPYKKCNNLEDIREVNRQMM